MRRVVDDPFAALRSSLNLGFEVSAPSGVPAAWRLAGDGDVIRLDDEAARTGKRSIRFDRRSARKRRSGIANTVDAVSLRGRVVVLEGEVRREAAMTGGAALWLRAEGEFDDVLAVESSARVSNSSSGWQRVRTEIRVPDDALRLRFGLAVDGDGITWGDALSLSASEVITARDAIIAGTVRDSRSTIIAGASVALTSGTQVEARTVTDHNGRFSFSVPAGRYGMSATVATHTAWFAAPQDFSGEHKIAIKLEEGPSEMVRGSVSGQLPSARDLFVTMWRISDDRGDVFAVPIHDRRFEARLPAGAQGTVVEFRDNHHLSWPVTADATSGPVRLTVFSAPPPDDSVLEDVRRGAVHLSAFHDASVREPSFDRAIASGAVVVGLGEPTHGTHDAFDAKAKIISWLVRHRGWRTLALEADVVVCRELNAHIHGGGMPLAELFDYFGDNIATKELAELVESLRLYNEAHRDDPVAIVGLDELQPIFARGDIEEQLAAGGLERWRDELAQLQPLIDSSTWGADALKEDQARAVSAAIERIRTDLSEHRDLLRAKLGADRYALIVDDVDYLTSSLRIVADRHGLSAATSSNTAVRDEAMATRVLAHVERDGPVIVWAHNAHIGRSDGGLGTVLSGRLQDRYIAVGMLFAAGAFQAVDDEVNEGMRRFHVDPLRWGDVLEPFVRAKLPPAIIDLRSLPSGAARSWFDVPRLTREFGFSARRDDPSVRVTDVLRRFDWLVAFPTTRRALPFQRTLRDLP